MKNKKKKIPYWFVAIVIIIALIGGNNFRSFTEKATQDIIQESNNWVDTERMEIPQMSSDKQGQIIQRAGYTLSYNNKTKTPQWVAWELTREETRGNVERNDEFLPDPQVIGTQVETYDYSRSGYDRGHMAPAGDMKWSKQAMRESFYMSNVCPQDHNLNKGDWNDLEIKTREWARKFGRVYVVCGPIYDENKSIKYIGDNRVAVPHAFFKAILLYQKNIPIAMGFLFQNQPGHQALQEYIISIDQLEQKINMDLFSILPDDIENEIERITVQKLP